MLSTYTLISGVLILFMGIFVLLRNIYSKINIVFFLFSLSTFIWLFCFSLMYMSVNVNVALTWAKFGDIGILYLPIFAYYFILVLLNIDQGIFRTILISAFILSIPILLLSQTDYFFLGIKTYPWGCYPLAGSLYFLLIMFFSLFIACIPILYYSLKNGNHYNQTKIRQIQYVLFAFIGACTGFVDYLPKYNISVYPWGHFSVLVFISVIAYAILKHHLMDIKIILRKGFLWSVALLLIVLTYFSLVRFSDILIVKGMVQPPLKFIYLAAAFGALVLHFVLGAITILNSPNKTLNRVFSLLSFFIFVWIVGCFVQSVTDSLRVAFMTEVIVSKFYVIIPALFLHTFFEALKVKNNKIIFSGYLFASILFVLSFGDKFIPGVSYGFGARYLTDPGPLYFLFPLSVAYVSSLSFINLLAVRKQVSGYYRVQLDYLLIAGCSVVAAVCFSFLMIYKIIFTPFDEMLNIVYGVVIGYAILKHRLMDITVVVRKGLIYSLLIGLFTGSYVLMLNLFGNYLGKHLSGYSFFVSSLLIVFFALIFQPLRDKLQEIIDHIFYRGKYDYQKTIKELSGVAVSITDLNELINKVFDSVLHAISIKNISIFILDKRSEHFINRKTTDQENKMRTLSPDYDLLIKQLNKKKEALIAEENPELSDRMSELKAAIVFPMLSKNQLVGFMSLGDKLSGEVYSSEDIDLLTTLSNQMGVAIENAILNEEALDSQKRLFQADKLATVGALAAGLAHEIKNPIAAIKGYSQMIGKAIDEKDYNLIQDFERVVPRQLDRINEIVEKLLYLSKPAKMKNEDVNVNYLLEEIVKLLEKQAIKNNVKLEKEFEELPAIKADPDQLTQAFLNLILNAIQSIGDGGYVKIRTKFFELSTIKVQIIDNGVGIAAEKLPHIFDPFFTTKEQGSGLGLAVTKKILLDHHGAINVSSELGKGTVFTIELPLAK
jgi:signal transduction histidine kinase